MKPYLTLAACFPLVTLTAQAQPKQPLPVYLCGTPTIAAVFWDDLVKAHQMNIRITHDVQHSIAVKNKCERVESARLRPQEVTVWMFRMTDGQHVGWMHPAYYIQYVNSLP